jgi:hypothetical protein
VISHEDIFRTGVALLAFVVAFYALIARERKTPYILNSIYAIAFIVLISLLLSLVSQMIEPRPAATTPGAGVTNAPSSARWLTPTSQLRWSENLNRWAGVILAIGVLFLCYRLLRIHNRQINFRNDQPYYSFPFVLRLRHWWQRTKRTAQPRYEHNPEKFPTALVDSIKKSSFIKEGDLARALANRGREEFSISAVCLITSHHEADEILSELAMCFLKNDCFVQYTTCSRHPIEFLLHLKKKWLDGGKGNDWKAVKDKVVVVDGYTPHFGFTDTIYPEWTQEALRECLDCIKSPATYAGIHTALANAFNKAKATSGGKLRAPQLCIYEGTHALVDLESSEQYRVFVRHVMPSERLWGGMFTVFAESTVSEENLSVLKQAADMVVYAESRKPKTTEAKL